MSSSNSPCAACKFLRRKCTQECVFAPYFPPDNPQRFAYVHKVFGASNVAKLLNELSASQRDDAVKSLAYEAEARLRDPVYGVWIQGELSNAKKELATYIGPQALQGMPTTAVFQHLHAAAANPFASSMFPSMPATHGGQMVIRDPQPPQQQVSSSAPVSENLIGLSPSLALGSFENPYHHMQQQQQQGEPHAHAHHIPLEAQLLLTPQQEKQAQQQTQQPQLPHHYQQQHLDRGRRGPTLLIP
ncbi:putative transcription factor AS2-LOB family [Lupinus albus]|uniref:Putative transcription factor AS2-LOB family n=1 Tax=Lupinus albus TaxID=3870 RepID=A0A6A4NSL4_LUPAL|nr:putative transcription factor AS2-LOB family [Lupinus albus]